MYTWPVDWSDAQNIGDENAVDKEPLNEEGLAVETLLYAPSAMVIVKGLVVPVWEQVPVVFVTIPLDTLIKQGTSDSCTEEFKHVLIRFKRCCRQALFWLALE
jgi:hypothetical protein